MSTSVNKTINKVKDAMVERQGPVEKDQSRVPYEDAINAYWERDLVTFAIPAHNGGRGPAAEFTRWMGDQVARADLPTTHGLDTRNSAYGVQTTAQELFADAVGAKQTFFSTCGSSMSVRVAIMAVAGPGDTIVMARNGHKSTFGGLILAGVRPVYVEPWYDEELEIAHGILPEDLEAALDANPEAKAALIFSPSYYGTSTDIRALAEVCHAREIPLVTDDAWGLDYGLGGHPDLPEGSLAQGADIAIGSGHKTAPALTQTSVLSVGSDRIDMERLTLCFEIEQSTSVSALLASSIDGARCQMLREGKQLLDRAVSTAKLLRTRLESEVPEVDVVDTELLAGRPSVKGVDPTHVLIEVAPLGITGYQAIDWMRAEHNVDLELVDHRRVMPLVTFAHGEAEVDRLVTAVRALADKYAGRRRDSVPELPSRPAIRSESPMTPREAFFADTEDVSPKDAVGRVCAEYVTPYPPGIPAVAPGELYTEENVEYLQQFVAAGGFVEGTADPSLGQFRVVRAVVRGSAN